MDTYDARKTHKDLYSPPKTDFVEVDVPELRYLAIDGEGDPNTSPTYAAAVEALYAVGYTLKFAGKKSHGRDFSVGPLEGLWYSPDPTVFTARDKGAWQWTMLIPLPDWVTADEVDAAIQAAHAKKGNDAIRQVRLQTLTEGRSVQILHLGSYDDEAPTLALLHDEYLPEHGLTYNGHHHEIYLNDPRRTAPEKLRTVLRQPVRAL